MSEKHCLREFLKYVILNILGMTGLSCYILADTFFIAKGMGSDGLTALNLIIPVYNLMHGTGLMLGMGGASRFAIYKGEGKADKGSQVFTHTVALALTAAVFYMLAGGFLAEKTALLMGADAAVLGMCVTYLKVMLLFAPMYLLNDVVLCFVRNDGAPQLAMTAMLVSSFSNIILDYVFIFIFGMGMFGAVLATGLSPVIGLLVQSSFFLKRKNSFRLRKCEPSFGLVSSVLGGGASSFVAELSSGIVILVFNVILLGIEGNTGVAAYGVIANISLVMIAVYTGIGQGMQPLVSRYYGMRKPENMKKIQKYGLLTAGIVSAAVYAGVFFGAEAIVSAFNGGGDLLLQEIAEKGVRLYFTGGLFAGINIVLMTYFMASDRIRPANLISVLRGFVLVIPLAFLLSGIAGLTGLWLAFPVTELLTAVTACIFVWKGVRES